MVVNLIVELLVDEVVFELASHAHFDHRHELNHHFFSKICDIRETQLLDCESALWTPFLPFLALFIQSSHHYENIANWLDLRLQTYLFKWAERTIACILVNGKALKLSEGSLLFVKQEVA